MPTIKINVAGKIIGVNERLKKKLDMIKKLQHKNWDFVIVIDGVERSGKSTLGFIISWYLTDGKMTINNVASGSDDAIRKCEILPDKSLLMVDEGSLVFSSKDTMKKEQRKLTKILNVIGQKSMIFVIVLPSFFDLNKFIAIQRSRFLLHVYTDEKLNRGRFAYFGEKRKKVLYTLGKKNFGSYGKPKANFTGLFDEFNPFGEEYKNTKRLSLFKALREEITEDSRKTKKDNQKFFIYNLEKFLKKRGIKVSQCEKAEEIFGIPQNSYSALLNEMKREIENKKADAELGKESSL